MINYGRHAINSEDISAVQKVLESDWLTTGPLIDEFEAALSEIAGAPCLSVSSGTAALHCAYAAIGLEPGDEVITPPITFIATQATAVFFGAKIVFADVQTDTANIDPKAVEAAITKRTKAIVAVDYAGQPADLDELRSLADKYKLYLIEDASHSLGSIYKGQKVGSVADLTTFSFFPTQNITTGEGGAVASRHPDLLDKAKIFSRQGMIRNIEQFKLKGEGPWHQEVHEFGLNYRLPDILCALGLSQLKRLTKFKSSRRKIFSQYTDLLNVELNIKLPVQREYVDPMWHLFPVRVNPEIRKKLFEFLHSRHYRVQVNYLPVHLHPVFSNTKNRFGEFPNSENFYRQELSLPIYAGLKEQNIHEICKLINDFIAKAD